MATTARNVLGGELEECGRDPLTGFYRDGCCRTGPEDRGNHTICTVVTTEFLEHQRSVGNDLVTPMPEWHFPGLLAATHERALDVVPLQLLQAYAADIPDDPSSLL